MEKKALPAAYKCMQEKHCSIEQRLLHAET
jgi:hypothetical protein